MHRPWAYTMYYLVLAENNFFRDSQCRLKCIQIFVCTVFTSWHSSMKNRTLRNAPTTWYFQRSIVSCRAGAKRVEAKGVFVGAEVVRGPNWRFGDQDGEK